MRKHLMRWLACIAVAAAGSAWAQPAYQRGYQRAYQRADIDSVSLKLQDALLAGDIATLERLHAELLVLERKAGPGRWMMESFVWALDNGMPVALKDRNKLFALLARWKEEQPRSGLQPIYEANAWFKSGWEHRGSGSASAVSPESMQLFRRDMERASRIVHGAGPEAKESPLYYRTAIAIAGSSGADPQALDDLYREGARRFPINLGIVDARRNFLMPQLGGSYDALDRLIRDAVLRTQASEGTAFYARLYVSVARNMWEQKDFFAQTRARWPLMRHAFEDAVVLDADTSMLNAYATFACMAGDRETLRRIVARLGPRAALGWGLRFVSPDACMEMARAER